MEIISELTVLQAVILGAVQGLTEFLPVSSSGHLVLLPNLLRWGTSPLVFDTTLHLGTAAALVLYFFKDLWSIFINLVKEIWNNEDNFGEYNDNAKLGLYILLGSIPAGVLGLLLEEKIEVIFRAPYYVALFLVLGSGLLFVSEYLKKWQKNEAVGPWKSLFVGMFQALALFPGISRSGATISGGMLFGLSREAAAKFSFLLSVPIVVLAGMYKLYDSRVAVLAMDPAIFITGFLSSMAVGIATIKFLMNFVRKHSLYVFIFYRIAVAVAVLLVL